MRSGRSQLQETVSSMIPFVGNVQNMQIYRDRKWIRGFLGLEVVEVNGE